LLTSFYNKSGILSRVIALIFVNFLIKIFQKILFMYIGKKIGFGWIKIYENVDTKFRRFVKKR